MPICLGNNSVLVEHNTISCAGHELIDMHGSSSAILHNNLGPNPNHAGIHVEGSPQVVGNTMEGNGSGIGIFSGSPEIIGNVIEDCERGIVLLAESKDIVIDVDAVLKDNTFSNNGWDIAYMRLTPAPDISEPTGNNEYKIEPTERDVRYGKYERNVMDFWQAASGGPTPVYVYFHGGAFVGGGDNADDDHRAIIGMFGSLYVRLFFLKGPLSILPMRDANVF